MTEMTVQTQFSYRAECNHGKVVARGFSLVEVALALGILSFALIPLLGLMATGFHTLRDSNAEVRASLIAQKIIAAAQMVPFSSLQDQSYQMDYEGNSVTVSNDAVFHANMTVTRGGGLLDSTNTARVRVIITGSPLGGLPYILSETVSNMGK